MSELSVITQGLVDQGEDPLSLAIWLQGVYEASVKDGVAPQEANDLILNDIKLLHKL